MDYIKKIIETSSELIKIPSVKGKETDEMPYGKECTKALESFLNIAKKEGLKTKNLQNRVGYAEFGEGENMLGIVGHLDVVPAGDGWDTDPFEPVLKNGGLFGRGAIDDKVPLVICLWAVLALKNEGFVPKKRIRLIAGLDEESGSGCMKHYVKNEEMPTLSFTPDADFPVIFIEKGILRVKLTAENTEPVCITGGERANMVPPNAKAVFNKEEKIYLGKSAHAASPQKGENAIIKAIKDNISLINPKGIYSFINTYFSNDVNGKAAGLYVSDIESGEITFNLGLSSCGEENTIIFDIRYPVSTDVDKLIKRFGDIAKPYGVLVEVLAQVKPLYVKKDSFLVSTLLNVYNLTTKEDAKPLCIGGGTYARELENAVAFGPAFSGMDYTAHQPNEYIEISCIEKCFEIYKNAVYELTKDE